MTGKPKLSRSMTVAQFDNGYWYATEVKAFAKALGIAAAGRLRKDELEKAVKAVLARRTPPMPRRSLSTPGAKDVAHGLRPGLRVVRYTNDPETKDFLEREGRKLDPGMKRKSGARYRLNRWREDQLAKGRRITYGDLAREYVRLNRVAGSFAKAPTGRYINFLSDYFAAFPNAPRSDAMKAWKELKTLDAPKNFRSWARIRKQ